MIPGVNVINVEVKIVNGAGESGWGGHPEPLREGGVGDRGLSPLRNILGSKEHLDWLKACVRYFHQIFIFSPNDSPSKTMKNAFYFI